MNKKINLQELSALLSEKSEITKKDAEIFLKEYFNTINEGLIEDKLIKIKGIGTFKLTIVNDRGSVDVVTKERVIIPAHYKVSYVPDAQLALSVNEPFALFEPFEIEEETISLQEETMQAKTLKMAEETRVEEIVEEKNIEPEIIKTVIDEKIIEGKESKTIEGQKGDIPIEKKEVQEKYFDPIDNTRNKRSINWLPIVSILLILAIGAVVTFVYYEESKNETAIISLPPTQEERTEEAINEEIEAIFEETVSKEGNTELIQSEATPLVVEEKKEETTPPATTATVSKTRTVQQGQTLRIIAEQELGSRDFWIYIYLKNKNGIKNPNLVPIGTPLVIPNKSEYGGIDANDPACIQRARQEVSKVK